MYPVVPGNARINVENEIVVGDHLFPKNVSFTFVILYCWKWLLLVNLITFLFILYVEEIPITLVYSVLSRDIHALSPFNILFS